MKKLLYFSAAWCQPCKMFGPIMDEVSEESIPVQKVDVDAENELSQKYQIRNVPTVILVNKEGTEVAKFIGVKSKQQVIDFYNEH